MKIKKAMGFKTEDGRIFATLNEAAGHTYSSRLKDAIGRQNTGVFGISTLLANSREIAAVLNEYNEELDKIEAWTA